jgi:hypothetical protein
MPTLVNALHLVCSTASPIRGWFDNPEWLPTVRPSLVDSLLDELPMAHRGQSERTRAPPVFGRSRGWTAAEQRSGRNPLPVAHLHSD